MSEEQKSNIKGNRTILEVPFEEKDTAKELGAWWDPEIRKWFVPSGRDTKPFKRWFSSGAEQADSCR